MTNLQLQQLHIKCILLQLVSVTSYQYSLVGKDYEIFMKLSMAPRYLVNYAA